nr:acyl-CoA carboxylase epsilon subunit [Nocardioides perillae]
MRVVNPDATPEEVAAIVAVVAALGGGEAPAPRRTPEWSRPARGLRQPLTPGPGAWRASALPR